jgi:restriction system protein
VPKRQTQIRDEEARHFLGILAELANLERKALATKSPSDELLNELDKKQNEWIGFLHTRVFPQWAKQISPDYAKRFVGKWPLFDISILRKPAFVVQTVIEPYGSTEDGQLIRAASIPWQAIARLLKGDWNMAYEIPPRVWEEIIAAAFDKEGFDKVILTPRSGDYGRDVIAEKSGMGCIRIIDSVKAYKPGRLVRHDDVRALIGVLSSDHNCSKGILTTTSDFAPGILTDKFIAPLIPHRLELMNGATLRDWLTRLSKKACVGDRKLHRFPND